MKQYLKSIAIALFATVVFSSCFKIEELIRFKGADSGTVEYIVDVSSMMSMVKMFGDMANEQDGETEEAEPAQKGDDATQGKLTDSFGDIKAILEGVEGVSNVEQINDEANSRFGVRADFANMKALNTVLSILYEESESKEDYTYMEFVKRKKNTYEYLEPINLRETFEKAMNLGETGEAADPMGGIDPMMFFSDLSVSSKLVFDKKKVKKSSNKASAISEDSHEVSVTCFPFKKNDVASLKNKVTVQ